ncbi:response regulator transcription factor [Luteococcus japonicus]|uniref:Two component transcriptional regulator, winged helix family n=1 Tax=Luteococcus japonicus LSP_Lj1 TaxID=1255658 RepID=A0A1R4I8B8_9ACTN|nr:response regulator transcription factor [Luteococcus japonicus]SJN16050.1 two component transcriptional regulator, winged helix family [Luteococcus japonicus LSP_Lj1]
MKQIPGPVVLVVEDDRQASDLLAEILGERGMRVVQAFTGPDGMRLAHTEQPDLVLLDLMLPFKSGDEVLRAIRERSQVPVIIVSARETTRTKIDLLNLGADDYITKPFDIDEVVARCEAALRRAGGSATPRTLHRHAGLELDEDAHTATAGGVDLALTATEFGLLTALIRDPRIVHPKARLYAEVWGEGYGYDERTVNAHMHNLRRKIKNAVDHDPIKTVWGIGYTLREQ